MIKDERLNEILPREFGEIGTLFVRLLEDSIITTIRGDEYGRVWIRCLNEDLELEESEESIVCALDTGKFIELVAKKEGKLCDENNPVLNTELSEYGFRFQAIVPRVSNGPIFTIRKPVRKYKKEKEVYGYGRSILFEHFNIVN